MGAKKEVFSQTNFRFRCRQHGKEVIFVSHGIVEKDRRLKVPHQILKEIDRLQGGF